MSLEHSESVLIVIFYQKGHIVHIATHWFASITFTFYILDFRFYILTNNHLNN